ncbi:MAG: hypothetical protein ACXVY9_01175, partial [Terriglobales bacterium]
IHFSGSLTRVAAAHNHQKWRGIYSPQMVFLLNKHKERNMKKLLVLLAMVMAFTLTSVAQTSSSSSGQTDQTTTSKTKATSDNTGKAGKAKKEATLTGCLNSDASMLTNGNYKNGVKVGPGRQSQGTRRTPGCIEGPVVGHGSGQEF